MLRRLISRRGAVAVIAMALSLSDVSAAEESVPDYDIPDIPGMADAVPDAGPGWWPEDARLRLYGVFSVLDMEVAEAGPFNIGNFAGLPDRGREGELRPELRLPLDDCTANLKPRLRYTSQKINGQDDSETEFFFNAAYLECRLGYAFELSAGRQSLQWGNGQYRSPSNPFFAETVLFNPVQEVLGKDFVTASYRPSMDWGVTYIAHLDNSHVDPGRAGFERGHGIKLDWTGRWFSGGAIWSKRHDRPSRFGAYSTFILSDALLVYGEGTTSRDAAGLLPLIDGNEVVMVPANGIDNRRRSTLLTGMSYTFAGGLTAYLEYLHSNEGFNDRQAEDWLTVARSAAEDLNGPDVFTAAGTLAGAVDPGWRQLRNDYLFLQLVQTEFRQKADLALRYVRNLDDDGYEISAAITVRLGDYAEWFFSGNRNYGGSETEFGRLSRYAFQTGFRIYAF